MSRRSSVLHYLNQCFMYKNRVYKVYTTFVKVDQKHIHMKICHGNLDDQDEHNQFSCCNYGQNMDSSLYTEHKETLKIMPQGGCSIPKKQTPFHWQVWIMAISFMEC